MDFGKDKKIESLEQKISELSENIGKLSEKQNSQYTDIMMFLKKTQDSISEIIKFDEEEEEEDPFLDDELYEEAKDIAIKNQKVSTFFLQRKLRIGYARVARLLDRMEEDEIVGPVNGSNPREILVEE